MSASQGVPYDFSSIMHVRHNAFSCDYHKSTIIPRNRTIPNTILGSSATATDLDYLHLNLLYCGGTDAKFMYVYLCAFGGYFVQFLRIHAVHTLRTIIVIGFNQKCGPKKNANKKKNYRCP